MSVKLLTEHILEFLSLKEATQARLSLHLSKCHIVGNHMSRLNYSTYNEEPLPCNYAIMCVTLNVPMIYITLVLLEDLLCYLRCQ